MGGFYALIEGKVKPLEIAKISDDYKISEEEGLQNGLVQAIISESELILPQQLVLAGNPVAVSGSDDLVHPQGHYIDFHSDFLVANLEKLASQYEPEVVLLIGNYNLNPSYFNQPLFPVVPFRIMERDKNQDYQEVNGVLFRYENGKVVCVSLHEEKLIPGTNMEIDPKDLFLLESPSIYGEYGRPGPTNRTKVLLSLGQRRLSNDRFSSGKIVGVIGEIRGDGCYSTFPFAMLGYKPS